MLLVGKLYYVQEKLSGCLKPGEGVRSKEKGGVVCTSEAFKSLCVCLARRATG
jgi:hypothetical protein